MKDTSCIRYFFPKTSKSLIKTASWRMNCLFEDMSATGLYGYGIW